MHHNHPKFFILSRCLTLSFSPTRWRPVLLHYRLLLRMQTLFRFGGGRTLHNVQFLMFRNTTDDPSASFPDCRSMAFPTTSTLFPILSSRGCCLLLHPPLLLTVFLPFLRCRGSSISRLLMPFAFRASPQSFLVRSSSPGSRCNVVPGRIFPDQVSLAPCHSCMAGHVSAGGQFLPRSKIS
jgi:hypothetical protein